jgi:demethylmenaquinone methyltransferase/2-methoxy-6-polyprenyl-1,4-benzoquinol methylase
MLSQAAEKGLEAVKTPVESLPFASERFDRIIMIDALHHVCDQQETSRELCRVLAPGGKVIIEEPDIRRFSVKLIALGEKLALMRSHFLPPEKIAGLFKGYPGQAEIVDDGTNTWIIFTKLSGKDFF